MTKNNQQYYKLSIQNCWFQVAESLDGGEQTFSKF